MRVRLWGTRGSLAAPGADTARFGGNTACVEVRGCDGTLLVLDAGTGIRLLGAALGKHAPRRIHVLLSHLHMDHIQGLGFFEALFDPRSRRISGGPRRRRGSCATGWLATCRRHSSLSICASFPT
jgi:phosphoribosyl 1,2-cyclic phosphodiesterase